MLEIENINVYYGKAHVLFDLSVYVKKGEIVVLLGSNGSGKTTTLGTISGLVKPALGTIRFMGEEIQGLAPDGVVQKGICLCPEGRRIFSRMTVQENLEMGAYICKEEKEVRQRLEHIYTVFPRLKERKDQLAGTLSGGEQQMLAIGRSLMSKPKFIMFDEPSAGLAPSMVAAMGRVIADIRSQGNTVLLVEQNAKLALGLGDRAYILKSGRVALSGNTKDLLNDENVQKAYLGGGTRN
jgi:branched-chain amino acid transport system ATP-binding protein